MRIGRSMYGQIIRKKNCKILAHPIKKTGCSRCTINFFKHAAGTVEAQNAISGLHKASARFTHYKREG